MNYENDFDGEIIAKGDNLLDTFEYTGLNKVKVWFWRRFWMNGNKLGTLATDMICYATDNEKRKLERRSQRGR